MNLEAALVYPLGMHFFTTLACGNATLDLNADKLAVADVAPLGIAVGAVVLHVLRFRKLSCTQRALILTLAALAGALLGAMLHLRFKASPLGIATLALLVVLIVWLRVRGRLFPWLARKELDPMAMGFMISRRRAQQTLDRVEARKRARAKPPAESSDELDEADAIEHQTV